MVFICLILLTLFFAAQSLFCKMYSAAYQGQETSASSQVYSIMMGLSIGVITLILNGFAYAPSAATLMCGILNAVALFLYNTSLVRGSNTGSYSFLMICSLSGNMLLPLFWDAVLNATPVTAVQVFAVLMLLGSFVLMNLNGIGGKSMRGYYIWCAVICIANGFYGILINMQQQLSSGAQRPEMVVTSYLGMAILASLPGLLKNRRSFSESFRMGKKALVFAVLSCIMATVASNLLVFLITRAKSLALVYAFNNGGVLVVSAIAAAILFREKLSPVRICGILLACAGIVMLSI